MKADRAIRSTFPTYRKPSDFRGFFAFKMRFGTPNLIEPRDFHAGSGTFRSEHAIGAQRSLACGLNSPTNSVLPPAKPARTMGSLDLPPIYAHFSRRIHLRWASFNSMLLHLSVLRIGNPPSGSCLSELFTEFSFFSGVAVGKINLHKSLMLNNLRIKKLPFMPLFFDWHRPCE